MPRAPSGAAHSDARAYHQAAAGAWSVRQIPHLRYRQIDTALHRHDRESLSDNALLDWASSIDVDARLTPLDPSGKPAAAPYPVAPCCGRCRAAARSHSSRAIVPPSPGRTSAMATTEAYGGADAVRALRNESTRQGELNRTIAFTWTRATGPAALPLDASSSHGKVVTASRRHGHLTGSAAVAAAAGMQMRSGLQIGHLVLFDLDSTSHSSPRLCSDATRRAAVSCQPRPLRAWAVLGGDTCTAM